MTIRTTQGTGPRWVPSDMASIRGLPVVVPVATVILSASIALAPTLGSYPVAAASVFWLLAVALHGWQVLRRSRAFTTSLWILAGATALAALRMSSSGLVHVLGDRPTLFWNVDWRYAATQAQGIARFGNLGDSLDYAGEPVQYHVGPAWIAGSLSHVTGIPVAGVLLIAIPLASIVVIAACGYRLLRLLGASQTAAALAPAVLLSVPSDPYLLLRRSYGSFRGQASLPEVFTDAENWWVSAELMHNSMFAIAVGLSAACLLVSQTAEWRVAMGAVGLASLLAVKPQYAVGFLAVLGPGLLIEWWRGESPGRRILGFGAVLAAGAAVAVGLNPGAISFVGVDVSLGPEIVGALVTSYSALTAASALIVVLSLRRSWRRRHPVLLMIFAGGAVIGAVVLLVGVESTTFLVDAEVVAQANAIGLPYTPSSQDPNLSQALRPVTVVLVLLATALFVGHVQGRTAETRWLASAGIVLVAATLPLTLAPLIRPTGPAAYEVSEEAALARLMSRTHVTQGRWLSNDLAEPAGNFARPLRATNLTSFGPAQFYVSNVAYMNWTQPDVVARVQNVQRFFLTEWSPWHREFLAEHDIDHIVVRDRCPTAWSPGSAGSVIGTDGAWTLVEVEPGATTQGAAPDSSPSASQAPRYGLSGCLDGSGPLP
jgi:hypothetical protein